MNFVYLFLLMLCGAIVYWRCPKAWRKHFLFGLSFLCVAAIHIGYAVYFIFNILLTHRAARGLSNHEPRVKRLRILFFSLIWLIGNLCFFKYSSFFLRLLQQPSLSILYPLGLSYIIFRLVHYLVEVYRGRFPTGSMVDLGLYVLFFPTFLAGPVERFPKFHEQTNAGGNLEWENVNLGLIRIVWGLFKKFLVADQLFPHTKIVLENPEWYSQFLVFMAIFVLAWVIYFDFSGYTDIALGISRLYGYSIIENFNKPFFQKNIAMFWRNWHISVYSWIRDYFFFPLFGYRASLIKIYLGVFLTMLVFMLWHEASINWLILGVYHGLGLVFYMLYQESKKRVAVLRQLRFRGSQIVSTTFTFVFVSVGFLFFYFSPTQVATILKKAIGI